MFVISYAPALRAGCPRVRFDAGADVSTEADVYLYRPMKKSYSFAGLTHDVQHISRTKWQEEVQEDMLYCC
jgi:hypothetical protein